MLGRMQITTIPSLLTPPPAVQWEQKSLAQHLKWNFTDEQRDQLMKVRGEEGGGGPRHTRHEKEAGGTHGLCLFVPG